jgi:PAS domain S-box-containing protein
VLRADRIEAGKESLEDVLTRAAGEWRRTFDAIDDLVVVLDTSCRVKRANRAAHQLCGAVLGEMNGQVLAALAPGEPWASMDHLGRQILASSPQQRAQTVDEAGRTWNLHATPLIEDEGSLSGAVVFGRDLTELVALQQALRRNETMAAMGNLVAGVAHEVRNPLFGVLASLDALEAGFQGNEERQQFGEVLRANVKRLSLVMEDLLAYGKPPPLALKPTPVEPVLRAALRTCAAAAAAREVSLVLVLESPGPVLAHGERLQRVFENLIDNAVLHSGPGSTVRVEAASSGDGVVCAVRDRGPGIDAADLRRIFEPFFSKRRGGTGLGLAIAQRIVEEHRGTIEARNAEGGGAELIVRLPGYAA